MLVVSVSRDVPEAPMLPEVEVRVKVVAVKVTDPDLVMVPDPLAVRVIVAEDELPVTTMPPLDAVLSARVPVTVDAPKLTESLSST